MGKALLVLVLGSGLVLTKQLISTQESEARTSKDQRAYQEEVIAREIAASAFNVAMGELRAYGEEVHAATVNLNGPDNAGRSGTYSSGRFAGGSYTVMGQLTSGHSVRVVATGAFGDAEYTMHDEYRVEVLTVRESGVVDVSFIESQAGYCSAVFYQAFTLDMEEGDEPETILLFAPDNRDRGVTRPARLLWAEAGTQMNFYIGVDQNCSLRPSGMNACEARAYAQENSIDLDDFDHLHHALLAEAGDLGSVREDIWAFVEQRPGKRNIWRIGWEDIHNTSWDRPGSTSPLNSLQALKIHGYDGVGWPDVDEFGYRDLRDYGSRPDFSDQVIEVGVYSPYHAEYAARIASYHAAQAACGEELDDFPGPEDPNEMPEPAPEPEPEPEPEPTPETEPGTDPETEPTPDPETEPTPEPEPETEPEIEPEYEPETEPEAESDPYNSFACGCTRNNTRNNKYPVLHRPPGNEANEHLLCLPRPAKRTHLRQHNDIVLSCSTSGSSAGPGRGR